MNQGEKIDLDALDNSIDNAIPTLKLLQYPRDIALIHLLRVYEDYRRIIAPNRHRDQNEFLSALFLAQDGLHFAVDWIHKYCEPPAGGQSDYETAGEIYKAAGGILESAIEYSSIWDLMNLLYRQMAVGHIDANGIINLRHDDSLDKATMVVDRFLSAPDLPGMAEELFDMEEDRVTEIVDGYLQNIDIEHAGEGSIRYNISKEAYLHAAQQERAQLVHLWEFDEAWDLGGYLVKDFREFWVCLRALCMIHHFVCLFSGEKGGALNSVVRFWSWARWVKEISRWTRLDKNVVELILNDLVYDPALYQPKMKQPDVVYQPFFRLSADLLALSTGIVQQSNAERNHWDLLSIIRSKLHSKLRNLKEATWINEFKRELAQYNLDVYGPLAFTHQGTRSDLDILIMDKDDHFALGCQLKWLTAPDRVKDISYVARELEVGIRQADISFKWLNTYTSELQTLLGISTCELSKYEFESMVISKNSMASGFIDVSRYPVINERLLYWILGDPHHERLRTLWNVAHKRSYLPSHGTHYTNADVMANFGDIRFHGKDIGYNVIREWNPETDIDIG